MGLGESNYIPIHKTEMTIIFIINKIGSYPMCVGLLSVTSTKLKLNGIEVALMILFMDLKYQCISWHILNLIYIC